MAKQQTTKTDELEKLVDAAQAASSQHREAQAEAQDAAAELARCRDTAAEAHASDGDVDAAVKQYHEAERTLDEAKIKIEGLGRKAERAAAAVDLFMREHSMPLCVELEPADRAAQARRLELVTQLVEVEGEISGIRGRGSQYVHASGHNPQGNVPTLDALSELMPVLQDIASGLRPLSSAVPDWKHRRAVEEHHRDQAELAAKREEDRNERAKDRASA